ncbi:YncE family protein [Mycobacterium conspicuum]|uniref:YncE family protein n=1 Tax=Mycobacterium conspicuum TaxID=44010 RepID=UPI000A2555FA|nr:YncE family protein [Mycobacterium conspicuum]ORV46403.1 hypothetical protein AWC00_03565 [Mycobacterium conspicuum]
MAVSPITGDIYVTNSGSDTVSVIDPHTNQVISTINVGNTPTGVAVSPAGPEAGDIYVVNTGNSIINGTIVASTVSVISPDTNKVIYTIPLDAYQPTGVAISPTGATAGDVYVTGPAPGTAAGGYMLMIDPNTNQPVRVGGFGTDVILNKTTTFDVTVGNTGTIYLADNAAHHGYSFNPVTTQVTGGFDVGDGGNMGIAVSPTGPEAGYIYVSTRGGLMVDNPTGAFTGNLLPVGGGAVAVSPVTGDVYVTNFSSPGELAVVNPAGTAILQTYDVGPDPAGVAISTIGPEAGWVYVANSGGNTVSVIPQ